MRRNVMINLGFRHDFRRTCATGSICRHGSASVGRHRRTHAQLCAQVQGSPIPGMTAGVYQQLLLVDGLVQRDLVISRSGLSRSVSAGVTERATPPVSFAPGPISSCRSVDGTWLGVDQPIGKFFRVRENFSRVRAGTTSFEAATPTHLWTVCARTRLS